MSGIGSRSGMVVSVGVGVAEGEGLIIFTIYINRIVINFLLN